MRIRDVRLRLPFRFGAVTLTEATEAYARVRSPLRAYAISDDPFAPLGAVRALGALYPNSQWETRRVAPRELGVKRIGHFGFFRERFRDSLWRESADWLERQ